MNQETIPCRVCNQPAVFFLTRTIREKLTVRYCQCPACGHVQTEPPAWLQETYRNATFQLDVGMADRSIWTAQTTAALAWRLGIGPQEPCLDWGAGTGLFVRLCRDYGLNFFYSDPYAQNIFALGFELEAAGPAPAWACLTAFEVAEHFPEPLKNFGDLFKFGPRCVLFSTNLYLGQPADWWYFGQDGQHVAFYTRRSLEFIGRHYGFHLASNNCDLHLFSRQPVPDRLLDSCRKKRLRLALAFQKKNGSRLLPDFDSVTRRFLPQAPRRRVDGVPKHRAAGRPPPSSRGQQFLPRPPHARGGQSLSHLPRQFFRVAGRKKFHLRPFYFAIDRQIGNDGRHAQRRGVVDRSATRPALKESGLQHRAGPFHDFDLIPFGHQAQNTNPPLQAPTPHLLHQLRKKRPIALVLRAARANQANRRIFRRDQPKGLERRRVVFMHPELIRNQKVRRRQPITGQYFRPVFTPRPLGRGRERQCEYARRRLRHKPRDVRRHRPRIDDHGPRRSQHIGKMLVARAAVFGREMLREILMLKIVGVSDPRTWKIGPQRMHRRQDGVQFVLLDFPDERRAALLDPMYGQASGPFQPRLRQGRFRCAAPPQLRQPKRPRGLPGFRQQQMKFGPPGRRSGQQGINDGPQKIHPAAPGNKIVRQNPDLHAFFPPPAPVSSSNPTHCPASLSAKT